MYVQFSIIDSYFVRDKSLIFMGHISALPTVCEHIRRFDEIYVMSRKPTSVTESVINKGVDLRLKSALCGNVIQFSPDWNMFIPLYVLCDKVDSVHTIRTYERMEVYRHSFLKIGARWR
jgi:hypothetical protein